MSEQQLYNEMIDWSERVSIDAVARMRADNPSNFEVVLKHHPEAMELVSAAAVVGAAVALECFNKVLSIDVDELRRIMTATP